MRIKNNNKGFTLVELIIAMSIFTIVIGMGYKAIDSTRKFTSNQSKVFTEQQAANLVNKYVTKDLELCKNIENLDNSELDKYRNKYNKFYGYEIINSANQQINYIVGIKDNKYDLLRETDGTELALIEKLDIKSDNDNPFIIKIKNQDSTELKLESSDKRNLYEVKICNLKEVYDFIINPRIIELSGKSELLGEGNIILHRTKDSSSISINETNEDSGTYTENIKVSRNNNDNLLNITMPNYKFDIKIENYKENKEDIKGYIDINGYKYTFEANLNTNDININDDKNNLSINIKKSGHDVILKVIKNNTSLVETKLEYSDGDLDIKLYKSEIKIEIDDDGEIELEIGDEESFRNTDKKIDNDLEVEISKKYTKNIHNLSVESKGIDIKDVELNNKHYNGEYSKIPFNSGNNLELDVDVNKVNTEHMIIVKIYEKDEKPLGQIYGDIRIEHLKKNAKKNNHYLKITHDQGTKIVDVDGFKGQLELQIKASTNNISKITKLYLLPTNEVLEIKTDKLVQLIELVSKKGSESISISENEKVAFEKIDLNSGGGQGNKNNEVIIKLKGN